MIKKIIILLCIASSVTCSGHGTSVILSNENKPAYKYSCDPKASFPQMVFIPFFKEASQILPNCETYPKHKTAIALLIFYHKWVEWFGDHNYAVRGMLERVMIRWDTEKKVGKRGYTLTGELFEGRNIIGRVESESIIWVWQGYNHRISQSALMHELVHLALRAKNGHADSDHEGMKYRGWTSAHSVMIIEAKRMLQAFNL